MKSLYKTVLLHYILHLECTDQPVIKNATSKIVHADNNVVYECDVGLNLIGNEHIECDPDGNWADRSLICIGKICVLIL